MEILTKIKKIHFIGIGGAGMIPLVNLLKSKDKNIKITGSDIKDFSLRKILENKGIKIYLSHKKENVFGSHLIIHSSAIKPDNIEIKEARKKKIPLFHRFDFLLELLKNKKIIAISGSHGKSTASALLGYLLSKTGFDPVIYLGAKTNYWPLGSRWGKGEYAVIETDEHDASFLKTPAYFSIILNVDNDHLDPRGPFLGRFSLLKKAFLQFALNTQKKCIINLDDPFLKSLIFKKSLKNKILSYSLRSKKANIYARNIKNLPFNLKQRYLTYADIFYQNKKYLLKLKLPSINTSNILAVLNISLILDIPLYKSLKIIKNFLPLKRRFEITPFLRSFIIDDYAHHPKELSYTLTIAKKIFPNKKIITVFEPHRFSRVALLYNDFAKALRNCDYLYLLEIDPSDEKNFYHISSKIIMKKILKKKYLSPKKIEITSYDNLENKIIKSLNKDNVLLFIGPGKIGNFVSNLKRKYLK